MLTTNQGLIVPDGTDNANVPLTFTDFVTTAGSGMENRLVQRYLSAADRTARNAAPNEGELSYLSDQNAYYTYTGAAWIPLLSQTVFAAENTVYSGIVAVAYTTAGAPVVGVTTTVPASGQVRVDFASLLDNTGAANTSFISPQLNAGAIIGAGAAIINAADTISISNFGQSGIQTSSFYVYTGLTPGAAVNAFLMHRVDGGGGAFSNRKIAFTQA